MANRVKVRSGTRHQAGADVAVAATATREAVSNLVNWSRPVTGDSGMTADFTGNAVASEALYLFWSSLHEQLTLAAGVFSELEAGLKQVVLKYEPSGQHPPVGSDATASEPPPPQAVTPTRVAKPRPDNHQLAVPSDAVPHQALVSIPGDHVTLSQLGRIYVALAEQLQGVCETAKGIKNAVATAPDGNDGASRVRATEVALDRCHYVSRALDAAAHELYLYAGELAVAQDAHSRAVSQIVELQADLAVEPKSKALEARLLGRVEIALSAQTQATHAANTFAAAMRSCSATQRYQIPQLTARFDAVTAAVLDSLVAHRWVSSNDAYLVAQRLEALSASEYQAFMNAEANAVTDAGRGNLYKALAGGQPVSAFTAPLPNSVVTKHGVRSATSPGT